VVAEQDCADDLQGFVFGALGMELAVERLPADDFKTVGLHGKTDG
jgi:hypothetical protein